MPSASDRARPGEPLALCHKLAIEAAIAAMGLPFAEYSFANLYLFREVHRYRFVDGPRPYITGYTYDGRLHGLLLTPADANDAHALLRHVDCLYPVQADDVRKLGGGFFVSSNANDSDYIYSAAHLAALDGRILKPKRQQAAAYRRRYTPELQLGAPGFAAPAAELLDRWQAEVEKAPALTDYAQCAEAIALAVELGLETALLSANGEPHGFLLASRLADGSIAVHFAKARRDIVGSYPTLFSTYAACCGVETLNFEQDLGIAGFRQAKRALDPRASLVKFRVSA